MSRLATLGAVAALGFLAGRLTATAQLRRLRALLAVVHHAASHDRLTGLPNRAMAAADFALRALCGEPVIVALLDLDRFKAVNDTYGHQAGDDVLRVVADRLATGAAVVDGAAARLSGDEFVLLLPRFEGPATDTVEMILPLLAQPIILDTDGGPVTVIAKASAGVAVTDPTAEHDADLFARMLHRADIALYHAKHGADRCRAYAPTMHMPANAQRHGPRRRDRRTDAALPPVTSLPSAAGVGQDGATA